MALPNGKYKTIYCHSDGYLTHNGALLLDHYSDRAKVEELLALGDISILAPNVHPTNKDHAFDYDKREEGVVVAYGRDRSEKNVDAKEFTYDELVSEDSWTEYFYVFTQNDEWHYAHYSNKNLRPVKPGLDKEYEGLGFPRPKDFYGFFWEEQAKELREEYQRKQQGEMS